MKSLLFLTLLLIGCTREVKSDFYIDPAFTSYVQSFENIYGIPVKLRMVFKDLGEQNVNGKCWYSNPRLIEIDTSYWQEITDLGREELVFHELGHCVLNLNHDNRSFNTDYWHDIPISIMYPYHFGDEPWYKDNREYYLRELASKAGR